VVLFNLPKDTIYYLVTFEQTSGCLLRIDFDSLEAKEAVSILPYEVPN
jgi:hypothetical protein